VKSCGVTEKGEEPLIFLVSYMWSIILSTVGSLWLVKKHH